jgi:hypothetical protein
MAISPEEVSKRLGRAHSVVFFEQSPAIGVESGYNPLFCC